MKEIELYDVISLKNGEDYVVIRMLENNEKMYYLLAEQNEDETPNINNIKIVEEIIKEGKRLIKEIEDDKEIAELGDLFISALNADI